MLARLLSLIAGRGRDSKAVATPSVAVDSIVAPLEDCQVCSRRHRALPGALAYERPAPFFLVPERQRRARVKINADLCVIDDRVFMIRGVVHVPLLDGATLEGAPSFEWGL